MLVSRERRRPRSATTVRPRRRGGHLGAGGRPAPLLQPWRAAMRIYWVYGGRDVTRTITATGETFEHLSESDRRAGCARVIEESTSTRSTATVPERCRDALPTDDRSRPGRGGRRPRVGGGAGRRPTAACAPGSLLRAAPRRLPPLLPREMGKPLAEAAGEVDKSALHCDLYADDGQPSSPTSRSADRRRDAAGSRYEPIGLVLAVMPWNFPVWQVMRFAARRWRPATGSAQALPQRHRHGARSSTVVRGGRLARTSSRPRRGRADVPDVVGGLIADDRGSPPSRSPAATGPARWSAPQPGVRQAVGARARRVRRVRGRSPTPTSRPPPGPPRARFTNAGQSCVCAKRFIVERRWRTASTGGSLAGTSSAAGG